MRIMRGGVSPREVFVGGLLTLAVVATMSVPPMPVNPVYVPEYRLDINHASALELQLLPGIGPALASRIVQHRQGHGPFATIESLDDVHGIGPGRLSGIAHFVVATSRRR